MQLFPGKGWQIENSEDNEARTPRSPAGSASPLKAAHSQLCLDFGADMMSCQSAEAVFCSPVTGTPATTSK